jgi:hypothetical protein
MGRPKNKDKFPEGSTTDSESLDPEINIEMDGKPIGRIETASLNKPSNYLPMQGCDCSGKDVMKALSEIKNELTEIKAALTGSEVFNMDEKDIILSRRYVVGL